MPEPPLQLGDIDPLSEGSVGLAVLGFPIHHSISPQLHRAALKEMARVDPRFSKWRYDKVELAVERLPEALPQLADLGYRGLNLTIPHKVEVLPLLDQIEEGAAKMGAVNTLFWENGSWKGYNSDGVGFSRALQIAFSRSLQDFEILIIGAGGAARAAVAQALSEGCAKIGLLNRSATRAQDLVHVIEENHFSNLPKILSAAEVPSFFGHGSNPLLVNATSLGLKASDPSPLSLCGLPDNTCVYDMIYNPAQTALLQEAKSAGFRAANGLGMLVGQAARSLEIWSEVDVPISAMEKAASVAFLD